MADTTELTFPEQFVHITAPPMPYLIIAGRSVYRTGDSHERRTLPDTFDIILVHSGVLHIMVGSDQVDVKAKEFLILPPGKRHGSYQPCERATIFSWLHFHCDGVVGYTDRPVRQQAARGNKNSYYHKNEFPISMPVYGHLDDATYEMVQSDFKEIEQAIIDRYQRTKRFRTLRLTEITCQSLFLRILATIGEIAIDRGDSDAEDLPVRVKRYMHDHYTLALTIREISRVFQCDPGYLSRVMRARYGMSTLKLLNSIRIEAAQRLLETTTVPIRDIGRDVGFDTPSYFTKRFREYTGASPQEWRDRTNAGNAHKAETMHADISESEHTTMSESEHASISADAHTNLPENTLERRSEGALEHAQ